MTLVTFNYYCLCKNDFALIGARILPSFYERVVSRIVLTIFFSILSELRMVNRTFYD